MRRPQAWMLIVATSSLLLAGCSGLGLGREGGRLAVQSRSSPGTVLSSAFSTGVYGLDDRNNLTVILIEGDPDHPTQAVAIRMFWRPRAAATPISPEATNASIQYIVFAEPPGEEAAPQVGVYSGAGYVFPRGRIDAGALNASVWEASLRLSDRSEGFTDLLGKAELKGGFTAIRDEAAKQRLLHRLNVLVRERLGYPRLVMLEP